MGEGKQDNPKKKSKLERVAQDNNVNPVKTSIRKGVLETNFFPAERRVKAEVFETQINIDRLVMAPANWNHPRDLDEAELESLATSIHEQGLIYPIVVWEQENGSYMILAGHQRTRAFRKLSEEVDVKYTEIKAIVHTRDSLTELQAESLFIVSNSEGRTGLSHRELVKSVWRMDEIYELEGMKQEGKRKNQVIAEAFKQGATQTKMLMSLQRLHAGLLELYFQGKYSLKLSYKLSILEGSVQEYAYIHLRNKLKHKHFEFIRKGMSLEELDKIVNDGKATNHSEHQQLPTNIKERRKSSKEINRQLKELSEMTSSEKWDSIVSEINNIFKKYK